MRARLESFPVSAGLVAAVVIALFGGTLDHGFHYDDSHSVVDNEALRDARQIPRFFVDPGTFSAMPEARMYRPLLLTTYAVTFAVGGGERLMHAGNVLLHAAVCVLFLALCRRLGLPAGLSLTAALWVAVHPLVTEPVNYVSSRSSSLVTLCLIGGLLALTGGVSRAGLRLSLWTTAAVMSKATGVVMAPLAALWIWATGLRAKGIRATALRATGRDDALRLLAGSAIVTAVYVAGTATIIGGALGSPVRSLTVQALTQLKAIPFYLVTTVMPVSLSVEPAFRVSSGPAPAVVASVLVLASGMVLGWRMRHRAPLVALGGAWALIALAPTLAVPLNILVNEHRMYAALPGLALAGVPLFRLMPSRVLPVIWLVLLAGLSLARNDDWSTPAGIWERAIERGPRMARPYVNLGKVHLEAARYEEAIRATQQGLRLNPSLPRGHYNVATANLHLGRLEEAEAGLRRAVELDPALMEAWNNLGNTLKEQGRYEEAIASYHRAHDLVPRAAILHNMGSAWLAAGRPDSAVAAFRRAMDGGAQDRESFIGLARALRLDGQLPASAEILVAALRRWPADRDLLDLLARTQAAMGADDEALATSRRAGHPPAVSRLLVGRAALTRGEMERAVRHFETGLAAAPDDAELLNALGEARLVAGDRDAALDLFRRAARTDPSLSRPLRNIGLVYLRHGRARDARAALQRALDVGEEPAGETWELLARAHEALGDTVDAIAAWEAAIAADPGAAQRYHNLGVLTQAAGAPHRAERLYRAALARDPDLGATRNALGHVLLVTGRAREAAAVLASLVDAAPAAEPGAWLNLASAYAELGEKADALRSYEGFLQHADVDDPRRPAAAARVDALRAQLPVQQPR